MSLNIRKIIIIALIFGFGVGISLYYGRLGFMPCDQSIVFDGGWRILSGQIPFRDFTTPTGITPIVMQALFFRFFGVSWFVYCLHAALINGLFCLLVYIILRYWGLSQLYAFLYSMLSGLVMYPPFGVPYMEQHAFFFLLLSVTLLLLSTSVSKEWQQLLLWCSVPCCLILTYLSKQNVAMLSVLPIAISGLTIRRCLQRETLIRMGCCYLIGSLFCVGALWFAIYFYNIDIQKLRTYYFALPSQLGGNRLKGFGVSGVLAYPFQILTAETLSPVIVILAAFATLPAFLSYFFHSSKRSRQKFPWDFCWGVALATSFVLVCVYFVMTTNNQKQNGFPYIFLSIGILHSSILSVLPLAKHRFFLEWCGLFFLVIALRDAYYFNTYVNAGRIVHEMMFNNRTAVSPQTPELQFMRFQVAPRYYRFTAQELDTVIDFFRQHPGNFLLIGDSSILYGITGRPSVSPSLWFHKGLTIPEDEDPEFVQYQNEMIENLKKYRVKYIVLEGEATIRGTNIEKFPTLLKLLKSQKIRGYTLQEYQILELFQPLS